MSSSEKNRRTGGGGASRSHQRGVGMIEVLVAVLLVSFGVLGAVAMHVEPWSSLLIPSSARWRQTLHRH